MMEYLLYTKQVNPAPPTARPTPSAPTVPPTLGVTLAKACACHRRLEPLESQDFLLPFCYFGKHAMIMRFLGCPHFIMFRKNKTACKNMSDTMLLVLVPMPVC